MTTLPFVALVLFVASAAGDDYGHYGLQVDDNDVPPGSDAGGIGDDDPNGEVFYDDAGAVTMAPVTIAPTSCPSGCYCFLTIMFCRDVSAVPSTISPASKYVDVSGSTFANPVINKDTFSSGYQNVEDLYIQWTNLGAITPTAFDNFRRLRGISLSHNQLTTLPSALLRTFARAKFISLFANSWNCNKDLAWLYEVYRSNPDKFGAGCASTDPDCRFVSQVLCATPPRFAGIDFANMTFVQYQAMQQTT